MIPFRSVEPFWNVIKFAFNDRGNARGKTTLAGFLNDSKHCSPMKNAARILTAFVAGFGLRLLATAAVKERAMHDAVQFREKAALRTTAPAARARTTRARGLPAAGLGRRERVE